MARLIQIGFGRHGPSADAERKESGRGGRFAGLLALGAALILGALLLGSQSVRASTASLTASPNPVSIPSGQTYATTTLTWNTGNGSNGLLEVKVANAQASFQMPTPSPQGSIIQFVAAGDNIITLYTADGSQQLATVDVKGEQGIVIPHNPCALLLNCGTPTPPPTPPPPSPPSPPSPPLILHPTKMLTTVKNDVEFDNDFWCAFSGGLSDVGVGPSIDVTQFPNELAAGFEDYYDPGTQPAPCPTKGDHFYRGGVGFDMNQANQFIQAHGLKSASLQFSLDWDGVFGDCLSQIQVNGDAWESIAPGSLDVLPGSALHTDAPQRLGNSLHVDLTAILALDAGLGGINPHMHFVFIGPNESFPNDSNSCLAKFGNFSLILTPEH